MHKLLRRTFSLLVVLLASTSSAQAPAAAKPASPDDAVVAQLKDAKWTAWTNPGAPAGLMVSSIAGDATTGPSLGYTKFPAGYAFPPHWHSFAESSVVISGTFHYVIDGKSYELGPGSVVVFPAKLVHSATCSKAGPCILMIRRAGAADFNFAK